MRTKARLITIVLFFPLMAFSQQRKKLSNFPGTILWKVYPQKSPGRVSYIIGTNHTFGGSFVDSFPVLKAKVAAAELFLCESTRDEARKEHTPAKVNYKAWLKPAEYAFLDSFLVKNGMHTLHALDSAQYPPAMLLYLLTGEQMMKLNNTIAADDKIMDSYLQDLARNHQVPVHALDKGFVFREGAMDLGGDNQKLVSLLVDFARLAENKDSSFVSKLSVEPMKTWNINYMFDQPVPVGNGSGLEVMLVERNEYWMPQLSKLFREKQCFMAVGIGHLEYSNGLLMQLRADGFVVEPVEKGSLK